MKSKSKTFYRYILSYALVLFLPVAVLFTLFSSFLFDRYSHEIAESSSRQMGIQQVKPGVYTKKSLYYAMNHVGTLKRILGIKDEIPFSEITILCIL